MAARTNCGCTWNEPTTFKRTSPAKSALNRSARRPTWPSTRRTTPGQRSWSVQPAWWRSSTGRSSTITCASPIGTVTSAAGGISSFTCILTSTCSWLTGSKRTFA
uniref:(northern house mosquito) hypothetical protein n=1 Tax=Culex pipiens TaxID=7175 RepID=A0A8D8KL92_CULPI